MPLPLTQSAPFVRDLAEWRQQVLPRDSLLKTRGLKAAPEHGAGAPRTGGAEGTPLRAETEEAAPPLLLRYEGCAGRAGGWDWARDE